MHFVLQMQELVSKGLKANEWVGHIQNLMNGKGGGKEMSAQATGNNIGCLNQAISLATQFVQDKLGISPKSKSDSQGFTGLYFNSKDILMN